MQWVSLLLLLGCVTGRPGAVPVDPPLPIAATPITPGAVSTDEATVKSRSHAWFAAFDRADLLAFNDVLSPAFVRFDLGRYYDAKQLTGNIQARIDRHAAVRSRTWKEERVFLGPNVAVFIGESVEHVPAEGDLPAAELESWNELSWVHDGNAWKLAHWSWRRGGLEAERERWNSTLREQRGFKITVNEFLADWAKGKKPGTAIDIAAGQGRNAVWLATQGWKVTAIDISDAGLEIAKKAAVAKKAKLTTIEADVDTYDLGKERWDLVTLIYAGSSHELIERIKPSIKKGGWFVVEFFGSEATAGTGIGGFAPGELAALFPGWKIEKDEVVEGIADWGLKKGKVARFAAQKP